MSLFSKYLSDIVISVMGAVGVSGCSTSPQLVIVIVVINYQ